MEQLNNQKGFTLIESIISVILVGFFINGLFLVWSYTQNKENSLEAYWSTKANTELAFEITTRSIREYAKDNINVQNESISFTDGNGNTWVFRKNGNDYQKVFNGEVEILLDKNCIYTYFTQTGKIIKIQLETALPPGWTGNNDLLVSGAVLVRN